jgi:ankyrin repeat protein
LSWNCIDYEKLKSIQSDNKFDSWLGAFEMPKTQEWIHKLINQLKKIRSFDQSRLEELFNKNIDLAFKIYIIYIQERNHINTKNFHDSVGQSALINFLENIQNCEDGSIERLQFIIASFYLSENNIKSFIESYRTSITQKIASLYIEKYQPTELMEVHYSAGIFRAANQLGFKVIEVKEHRYNQPSSNILQFVQEHLSRLISPFQLLEYLEGMLPPLPGKQKYKQPIIDQLKSSLSSCLSLQEDKIELAKLIIFHEDSEQFEINKQYILQLICQSLCEIGVLKKDSILRNGEYSLPKPSIKNEDDFYYWFQHFATPEEIKNFSAVENSIILARAILNNHTDIIEIFKNKDINLKILTQQGYSLLSLAASVGNISVIQDLLKKGIDVDYKDSHQRSALILAAQRGHLNIVQLLIENGAHPNISSKDSKTALMFAAQNGHLEIVRLLLEKGSHLNTSSRYGTTALMMAAQNGHLEIVQFLIKQGSHINAISKEGKTALMLAAQNKKYTVVEALLDIDGIHFDSTLENGDSLFIWAAKNGYDAIVEKLLKKKVDINQTDSYGNTALLWAAQNNHPKTVKKLIEHQAQINSKDAYKNTPFILAAQNGCLEVLQELLNTNQIDINAPNGFGLNPLFLAVINSKADVLEILLRHNANINFTDQDQNSALIRAAYKGHTEIVEKLLSHQANVEIKNKNGDSALIMAAKEGHTRIVEQLIQHGAEINIRGYFKNTPLILAAENGHLPVLIQLLEKGAEINIQNKKGDTALMRAAKKGHIAIVKTLIDKGANVTIQNNHRHCVFTLAAENGHTEVVKLLLEKIEDTPTHKAAFLAAAENGHTEVVKLLLTNVRNTHQTAFLAAAEKGHTEVVKLLLEKIEDTPTHKAAFLAAAKNGHTEVVKLLLANVGDTHTHQTAFLAAAEKGHAEIVTELIIHGAEILLTLQNPYQNDPMMYALFNAAQEQHLNQNYKKRVRELITSIRQETNPSSQQEVLQKFLDIEIASNEMRVMIQIVTIIPVFYYLIKACFDILENKPGFQMMFMDTLQRELFLKIKKLEEQVPSNSTVTWPIAGEPF